MPMHARRSYSKKGPSIRIMLGPSWIAEPLSAEKQQSSY